MTWFISSKTNRLFRRIRLQSKKHTYLDDNEHIFPLSIPETTEDDWVFFNLTNSPQKLPSKMVWSVGYPSWHIKSEGNNLYLHALLVVYAIMFRCIRLRACVYLRLCMHMSSIRSHRANPQECSLAKRTQNQFEWIRHHSKGQAQLLRHYMKLPSCKQSVGAKLSGALSISLNCATKFQVLLKT